ncbi:MAG: c-type cytochrome [Thermoleophilia bacterium]
MTRSFRVAIALCLGLVLMLSVSVIAFAGDSPGAAAFQQYCAACHGSNGQGTAYAPNIQGESAGDVIDTARHGDDGMPAFSATAISDSTLHAIGTYVSGLGHSGQREYSGGDDGGGHSASGSQYGNHESNHDGNHGGGDHEGNHDGNHNQGRHESDD